MMRKKTRDDLGLAITMLDSDRLRQWAEKLEIHGNDISAWSSRAFVVEQLRAVAGRIEATVAEVGTLRELAGISEKPVEEAVPQPVIAREWRGCDYHRVFVDGCTHCRIKREQREKIAREWFEKGWEAAVDYFEPGGEDPRAKPAAYLAACRLLRQDPDQ